ncbi:uncharacterized protein BX663DRAFT_526691 [Cokeromyces recurvatus]|uniref:uncharacterized protein n=1 Tax=Cokeromyces recurvatus TaxID=90255 RepID=UPI00221FBFA4|nr:uncharacterized protein BX663DRAFT_526691 [Cokeromyces recurvatus]KAI7897990.1 hypothetical protein BX663DRAFT_526691 [Cokeromyces recurvatus]
MFLRSLYIRNHKKNNLTYSQCDIMVLIGQNKNFKILYNFEDIFISQVHLNQRYIGLNSIL